MYGQTEATARLAYLPPEFMESKLGSIGVPIPGVTLSVLDESGKTVEPGQVGQIVAEGDNIALGYWNDPAETCSVFIDGKLYTGDLATVDQDGFIYIVDRAKDFLKCGGQRVSCQYLEDVLLECGMLVEAAVIGIPDAILGEAACAFVVPRERKANSISEQVHAFCRSRLQPTLLPKEVVVLDALPKNSSGKVLKQELRQQHAST
jgi:acyl-CoA synthetase (AMP-forming)/AMP-acid ligase II